MPPPVSRWVFLGPQRTAHCVATGVWRQEQAVERNRRPGNDAPDDPEAALHMHVLGACCEGTGKIYLNPISWNDRLIAIARTPDLGGFINVKGCEQSHHGLLVKREEPDEFAYLLVYAGAAPWYRMVGWMWGHEAKQDCFWNAKLKRPCFLIKPDKLPYRPEQLWRLVHER